MLFLFIFFVNLFICTRILIPIETRYCKAYFEFFGFGILNWQELFDILRQLPVEKVSIVCSRNSYDGMYRARILCGKTWIRIHSISGNSSFDLCYIYLGLNWCFASLFCQNSLVSHRSNWPLFKSHSTSFLINRSHSI